MYVWKIHYVNLNLKSEKLIIYSWNEKNFHSTYACASIINFYQKKVNLISELTKQLEIERIQEGSTRFVFINYKVGIVVHY